MHWTYNVRMTASTLTIRLNQDLKDQAAEVAESYGLDLSTVVRAFFTEMVHTNSIPLSLDYRQPNAESEAALLETKRMIAAGSGSTFTSGREMIEAALSQGED